MDSTHASPLAADAPPALAAGQRPRLVCLAAPRIEAFGQTIELRPRQASEPVLLLLRVVAAGSRGIPVARLLASIWPNDAEREARHRLEDCRRCLALLIGIRASPIRIDGDIAAIDDECLEVDSVSLECALSPLLDPFRPPLPEQAAKARALLGRTLSGGSVFLPGVETAWADAARHRIADTLARAARRLASTDVEADPASSESSFHHFVHREPS